MTQLIWTVDVVDCRPKSLPSPISKTCSKTCSMKGLKWVSESHQSATSFKYLQIQLMFDIRGSTGIWVSSGWSSQNSTWDGEVVNSCQPDCDLRGSRPSISVQHCSQTIAVNLRHDLCDLYTVFPTRLLGPGYGSKSSTPKMNTFMNFHTGPYWSIHQTKHTKVAKRLPAVLGSLIANHLYHVWKWGIPQKDHVNLF